MILTTKWGEILRRRLNNNNCLWLAISFLESPSRRARVDVQRQNTACSTIMVHATVHRQEFWCMHQTLIYLAPKGFASLPLRHIHQADLLTSGLLVLLEYLIGWSIIFSTLTGSVWKSMPIIWKLSYNCVSHLEGRYVARSKFPKRDQKESVLPFHTLAKGLIVYLYVR